MVSKGTEKRRRKKEKEREEREFLKNANYCVAYNKDVTWREYFNDLKTAVDAVEMNGGGRVRSSTTKKVFYNSLNMKPIPMVKKESERKKLLPFFNNRIKVIATVERLGSKRGWKGRLEDTILLKNIMDMDGNHLTDHLWMNCGKQFEMLSLEIGGTVTFEARVTRYERGYKGRRWDVFKPISTDYRLSYPTKVELVTG